MIGVGDRENKNSYCLEPWSIFIFSSQFMCIKKLYIASGNKGVDFLIPQAFIIGKSTCCHSLSSKEDEQEEGEGESRWPETETE